MRLNRRLLNKRIAKIPLWALITLVIAAAAVVGGVAVVGHKYTQGIEAVNDNPNTQDFTVEKGMSVKEIAAALEEKHLIRSAWAFELYAHKKQATTKFQAGTYAISPSWDVPTIVELMTKGRTSSGLVTILPGRRIDQVRADLINAGFTPDDVDQALDPTQYADLPIMSIKPAGVNSLEGLLWPDSWDRDASTPASHIIRQSLQAMNDHLTPDVQTAFAAEGLSPYQGLILASIVVQEVNKPNDQSQAAQVFMKRLQSGMVLGSDVTARYGAIAAGLEPDITYDSPYNTHIHKGLPPTPISTINASALMSAAHPASTGWLYFVTGDDGVTYFSTNLKDHEALTAQHCHKLCGN
jgi:UPF0755 protein